jgi:hypothetical protein
MRKKVLIGCFALMSIKFQAQCSSTVSPSSQSISCSGGVVSFTGTAISPTTNATYNWYSPLNPMPGGTPMQTSNGMSSTLSGAFSPGVYTLEAISGTCTTQQTFTITSTDAYPTYSMACPSNFSIGCAPLNQTTLSILNPVSTQTPPSTCSYTFLAPSFTGVVTPSIVLSGNSSTLVQIPGTWTVIVEDNSNFCRTMLPVIVTQNTVAPSVSASMSTQTLMCYNPTVLATGSSTTPNTTVSWIVPAVPPLVSTNTLIIGDPSNGPLTSSTSLTYANYTVVATSSLNSCVNTSVVIISQNFRLPLIAPLISISNPTSIVCGQTVNPVVLTTGNSTTTSGGGITAFITNPCWAGPSPQTPTCGLSSYSCYVPGVYTLTAMDNYNGCTDSGTITVTANVINSSFSHSVLSGGVVNFASTTTGTNINSTYFWDFGDGSSGTGQSTSHTYGSSGGYLVGLYVNLGSGCFNPIQTNVNVNTAPCVANASFVAAPTPTPQYWTLTPTYPYNITMAQWSWGDGSTSNGLYSSHSYSAAGTYSICLSATISCGASTTYCQSQYINRSANNDNAIINVQVIPPAPLVGIAETEQQVFNAIIYPNPSSGKFTIGVEAGQNYSIHVFDLMGKEVHASEISEAKEIDLEHLQNGIYFMNLSNGMTSTTKKLMIDK